VINVTFFLSSLKAFTKLLLIRTINEIKKVIKSYVNKERHLLILKVAREIFKRVTKARSK